MHRALVVALHRVVDVLPSPSPVCRPWVTTAHVWVCEWVDAQVDGCIGGWVWACARARVCGFWWLGRRETCVCACGGAWSWRADCGRAGGVAPRGCVGYWLRIKKSLGLPTESGHRGTDPGRPPFVSRPVGSFPDQSGKVLARLRLARKAPAAPSRCARPFST